MRESGKPISIGGSDFVKIIRNGYLYIDKTLLIKDLIDCASEAILFTRPRRFGKSVNMSMLKAFFEIDSDQTIFENLKIWQCGEKYRSEQGKYPVVYFSFYNFSEITWEDALDYMKKVISDEFIRHDYLMESSHLKPVEKRRFEAIASLEAPKVYYKSALKDLSRWLYAHHGIRPMIIIDEYDKPAQTSRSYGYYTEMINFLKGFYTSGLKDNPNLNKGIMTGVLRIAKESIFTGMNNFDVYTVFSDKFNTYFGFTTEDVRQLTDIYGAPGILEELKQWYDGYNFGGAEIYNPWSVLQYFDKGCVPRAYWLSTSGNEIIHSMLHKVTPKLLTDLTSLVQGKSITTTIPLELPYGDLEQNVSGDMLYSVLLMTGYLKKVRERWLGGNDRTGQDLKYRCELMIPNYEITQIYQLEILDYFEKYCRPEVSDAIQEAIAANDTAALEKELSIFLMESTSCFDGAYEVFYHGMMLGNVAMMRSGYYITSNLESGLGRFDIQMEPKRDALPGIIIELKAVQDEFKETEARDARLAAEAESALNQIENNEYVTGLKMRGVENIILYGMAFHGKYVRVQSRSVELK